MLPRYMFILILLFLSGTGCASSELSGTRHTIVYRPESTPHSRLQGTYSLIRASDWNGYASRSRALSQATADPKNGTLRFTLSAETAQLSSPLCLMIVGSGGQVSVRHNHSEKYTFRNPFWEEEFSRINARKQAGQSVAALHVEAESIKTRVNVVFRELEGYGAHSWADCREGAPPPSPQKPVTVVPSEDRPATASQVCAVAWEDTLQEMAGKLYVMAKRQAIWDRRAQGVEIQRKLKVFMTTPDEDKIQGLELAAAQGERFTQYQEALAFFKSLTSECEQKAVELLHEGARQWEDRVAYVAATPQRLLQQCQQTAQTHQQLSLDLSNVESKLTQAEQELARLREPPLSSGTARSLLSFTCTDR